MSNVEKQINRRRRPPIQLYIPPAQRRQAESKTSCGTVGKSRSENCSSVKRKPSVVNVLKEAKLTVNSGTFQLEDISYLSVNNDWKYSVTSNSLPLFCHDCKAFKYNVFEKIFPFITVPLFCRKESKYTLSALNLHNVCQNFKWYSNTQKSDASIVNNRYFSFYRIFKQMIFIFNCADIETYLLTHSSSFMALKFCEYKLGKGLEDDYCDCKELRTFIGSDCQYLNGPDYLIEKCLLQLLDKYFYGVSLWKYLDYVDLDNWDWNIVKIILTHETEDLSDHLELVNNNNKYDNKSPSNCIVALDSKAKESKKLEDSRIAIKNEFKDNSKTDHDQEKQIMQKAKQNINRKTRHIIKYVDDESDVLTIGNSNVSNWEDLFDNDSLQESLLSKVNTHKQASGTKAENVDDDSSYISKYMEEFEHIVELYDFPSSFATHDIIAAFNELNNDSMYVKWISDTQALLVLGSSSQAQKALSVSHPLIKVRSMLEASRLAIAKARQSDLKPAMKRPETNLNTARRLITSHLGAKSRVSKEQSAKERESLRIAKEMKKILKQNEKDAWEGNLRSTIN